MADRLIHLSQRYALRRPRRKLQDALTAYLFLLPSFLIIVVFGLWPVLYSLYVSLHKWNIRPRGSQCIAYWFAKIGLGPQTAVERTDCLGLANYTTLFGWRDTSAVLKMLLALLSGVAAYRLWLWLGPAQGKRRSALQIAFYVLIGLGVVLLGWSIPGLIASGEWTYLISLGLLAAAWLIWQRAPRAVSNAGLGLRIVAACALLGGAASFFFIDLGRMWELGDEAFFQSILRTIFYSAGTVPVQLTLSLILAYILFQGVKARGFFRTVYFLSYIAPTVATAVVFKRIFSLRDTGLMNQFVGFLGISPLKWLQETQPIAPLLVDLVNGVLGTRWVWPQISGPLGALLSGPSLALVSIMVYNWWVYIGYDTVIYLAGLGSVPHDLYEAASIDGADKWIAFRYITIPLLSPTIFFLAVMGTIGTFKAFNSIWVMYEQSARDAVDTTSILIFRTFRSNGQFGEATAMAFILFGIILALSEVQRRVGEKLVFYG